MTASPPPSTPRGALTRKAGVAVSIWLFAWLALLPAHDGAAQERSGSPSPERLWKAYPLDPTPEPGTQPKRTSSPAASAPANGRPAGAARAGTDGGTPVFILVLIALIAAGGMLTFAGFRRRRESEPAAAAVPLSSRPAEATPAVPALWHGPSGRFSRTATKTTARATATVAATQRPDGRGPGAADDPPRRDAPAAPAAAEASPVTPVVAPARAGSPPDPRLTWAAEIEWRQIDDESRFCVIARGAETVEVAQSPPLDWPPEGPAAVQAVTDAADELAAMLVAAGWKPLPPGSAWYAKRFAWEPAEPAEPAKDLKAAPKSTGVKPVAPPRPETRVPAAGESVAPDRPSGRRSRANLLAVLAALAVLGLIATLQLADGGGPAGGSKADGSIDLSAPLLVLVGVLLVLLMIRLIRRALR